MFLYRSFYLSPLDQHIRVGGLPHHNAPQTHEQNQKDVLNHQQYSHKLDLLLLGRRFELGQQRNGRFRRTVRFEGRVAVVDILSHGVEIQMRGDVSHQQRSGVGHGLGQGLCNFAGSLGHQIRYFRVPKKYIFSRFV